MEEAPVLPQPPPKSRIILAVFLIAILLLAAVILLYPDPAAAIKRDQEAASQVASSISALLGLNPSPPLNYTLYSPLILNGSATISYPPNYGVLAQYALSLVNQDRADFGLDPVSLSLNQAGQQHAVSMLRYGYFSHFDTQGFAPYMRYSLLGGDGAVAENVAFDYHSPSIFTTTSAVELAIKTLEHSMMYDDKACCNDGHRVNILTALHNKVSIGIAYNGTSVYFVEDFENDYINLTYSVSSSYEFSLSGTPSKSGISAKAAYVTYDFTPGAETPAQLNAGPHEYGPGNLTGGVLPPCSFVCPTFQSGITVYAKVWTFTATHVSVAFSLHDFIQHYGAGVYTVYLITGSDTGSAITSISIFVN
ncbi:MAG: CAP domain-containing protein [Thaumarchaeota archaeon]|nr:CAP domain-containing protein [Nitrososphaerota archaeon]